MSDEDATSIIATCPQRVVRVGLVDFKERHDTRTNGQHYTAADRQLTNQVIGGKLNGEVPDILARIIAKMSGVSVRMSRGCYEETAPVEFKL